MLQDGQLWESDQQVFQVLKFNDDYKIVMFNKENDTLTYVQLAIYKDEEKLFDLFTKFNMKPTSKKIVLRRGE